MADTLRADSPSRGHSDVSVHLGPLNPALQFDEHDRLTTTARLSPRRDARRTASETHHSGTTRFLAHGRGSGESVRERPYSQASLRSRVSLPHSDEETSGSDTDTDTGASRGARRRRRHGREESTITLSLSSGGINRDLSTKKEKCMKKVNRVFADVKAKVFDRLVAKGEIDGDAIGLEDFKLRIDFKRQIMHWKVEGDDARHTYDYVNDRDLDAGDRQIIKDGLERIVTDTEHISGLNVAKMQRVVEGSVGQLGSTNLSSYFTAEDHAKFGGRIGGEGSDKDKRTRAFQEFMQRDFEHAASTTHARDAKDVAVDAVSAIALNHTMLKTLRLQKAKYDAQLQLAQQAAGGVDDDAVSKLKGKLTEVTNLIRQFESQHMNPFLVSRTYKPSAGATTSLKKAGELKKMYQEHYKNIGEQQQGFWSKAGNKIRGRQYTAPKSYEVLASHMAGVEAYSRYDARTKTHTPDRAGFVQYQAITRQGEESSTGLEEAFYKRMIDQFSDRAAVQARRTAQELPPMFDNVDQETRDAVERALFGVPAVPAQGEGQQATPRVVGALENISNVRRNILRVAGSATSTADLVEKVSSDRLLGSLLV